MTAKHNIHGFELSVRAVRQMALAGLIARLQHFKIESSMKFKVQEETKVAPCRQLQGTRSLMSSQLSQLKHYKYVNEGFFKYLVAIKPQKQ